MATGLIIGKFLPPHRGHEYLARFGAAYCDQVTVHVCSIAREPIPGALRFQWMQSALGGDPRIRVVHCADENPQAPEDDPDHFWPIWKRSLLSRMDAPPDFVFASEPYGFRLAEELGARYVPVDHAREVMPVSGTALRADPLGHWDYLLPAARPYFLKRVALVGPESSGKSTLALRLARHFHTTYVPEWARGFLEATGGIATITPDVLETIARSARE